MRFLVGRFVPRDGELVAGGRVEAHVAHDVAFAAGGLRACRGKVVPTFHFQQVVAVFLELEGVVLCVAARLGVVSAFADLPHPVLVRPGAVAMVLLG